MSLGVLEEVEYQVHPERTAVGPVCLAVAVAASAGQEQGQLEWEQEQKSGLGSPGVAPFGKDY